MQVSQGTAAHLTIAVGKGKIDSSLQRLALPRFIKQVGHGFKAAAGARWA
jgi:hypothetical protein